MSKKDTAWQKVRVARADRRPQARDYISLLFNNFYEVKGDRVAGNDSAIVTGIALFDGQPVTIIAQQKGRELDERMACHFGMPQPSGYRKSMRAVAQAVKFNRPIICLIDTPGAFCGITAEKEGQGLVIAQHLKTMCEAKTPIISFIIGEGGSGGALALALCDKLIMLENSYFSIISPEGCASILFKDSTQAPRAAESLGLTAKELLGMGMADAVISEPKNLTTDNMVSVVNEIKTIIKQEIQKTSKIATDELVKNRQKKYLAMEGY